VKLEEGSAVAQEATMSHAQMIARAWLDESYRTALLAQGIEVPPPPSDLADVELVTSAMRDGEGRESALMSATACAVCECLTG
jgi:hypothetical protein